MLQVELPAAAAAKLRDTFADLPWPAAAGDVNRLLARLLQSASLLPPAFVETVLAFRTAMPGGPGALHITGLPIDPDLPPTPSDGMRPPFKAGHISECSLLCVGILLGEPVAYRAEKDGALVQDVFPTRADQAAPSNASWATALDVHTELTFSRQAPERPLHLASPDFVLLLGLRCPEDRLAATDVIEARDICERIEERHLDELRRDQFQLQAPYSFTRDGDGSRPWSPPVALLRGSAAEPSLAFDSACGVRALSAAAEDALESLRTACQEPAIRRSVHLRAGDMLVIDNGRCAHARSRFEARFDGQDRWLERAYVRRSLVDLEARAAPSYRVID
jgi:L-asparagine oxygenase